MGDGHPLGSSSARHATSGLNVSHGSIIKFEFLEFQPFDLLMNSEKNELETISASRFCNPFTRRMMENAAVLLHDARYCEILNNASNPMERRRDKALKVNKLLESMTAEQKAAFYAEFGLK